MQPEGEHASRAQPGDKVVDASKESERARVCVLCRDKIINPFTCCTLPPCVTEVFQLLSCCCALCRDGLAACCCRTRASRCSVKSSIFFCSSSHFTSKLSMVMHWLRRRGGRAETSLPRIISGNYCETARGIATIRHIASRR